MLQASSDLSNEFEPESLLAQSAEGSAPENAFPFSEELKVLEESLSLGLEEGMEAYREHLTQRSSRLDEDTNSEVTVSEADAQSAWDELARQVAGHVVAHLAETSLAAELDQSYALVERLYEDNRIMATHVQRLMEENEKLRHSLVESEAALARHKPLLGRLYLKF